MAIKLLRCPEVNLTNGVSDFYGESNKTLWEGERNKGFTIFMDGRVRYFKDCKFPQISPNTKYFLYVRHFSEPHSEAAMETVS